MLARFVKRCEEKHCIAFFQWRQRYREEYVDSDLIEECIESRTRRMQATIDLGMAVSSRTAREGHMSVAQEYDF